MISNPIPIDDLLNLDPDECSCEFTPYLDEDSTQESWHYLRGCQHCAYIWYSLHCPHDGFQRSCPNCGKLAQQIIGELN